MQKKAARWATAVPQFADKRKACYSKLLQCECEQTLVQQGQQALSHCNTAFHQLLKPLSRHEFEAEAKKHHVGQKLRSATRWDQFIGMAMSQLSGRQRSEERRVGKECRSWVSPYHERERESCV